MMRASLPLCCSFLVVAGLCTIAGAEEVERSLEHERLTTFQMVARSEMVVHGRVKDGEGRFAIVEVLSILKGEPPGQQLRIDFRDLNLSTQGQAQVVFRDGEEYVLFLKKKAWRKPKPKNADIVGLFHGRRGRMLLPAEGWGPSVEAIRGLVPLAEAGPEEQIAGLRGALATDNVVLREAILEELRRLKAITPEDLPTLTRLLGDPSPRTRSGVLTLIAMLFSFVDAGSQTGIPEERAALGLVLEKARGDADPAVRVEAVRTLGAWPLPEDIQGDLRAIASQDASQSVRYEAERILFRMRS